MTVEVFRTDVADRDNASRLVEQIQSNFKDYIASFDLEDADRILVVKCATGKVESLGVIELLKALGHMAEVLPDE